MSKSVARGLIFRPARSRILPQGKFVQSTVRLKEEEVGMARKTIDRALRREILDTRNMIQQAEKADCNESETRRRIERMFENLMGYDPFKHLSRERAIRGAGETEHVDFAIQIEEGQDAKPEVMVEIKRVCVDLAPKHLKQVSSYAINAGCEWILLTNSREWRVYHVAFGQPPITKLISSWNVLTDEVAVLADRFQLISFKSVRKGALGKLWQKTNVLHPRNLLEAILSEGGMKLIRRELKKDSGILLSPEDILSGVRRLLNESALIALETVRISFPERKPRKRKPKTSVDAPVSEEIENPNQQVAEQVSSEVAPSVDIPSRSEPEEPKCDSQ